MMVVLLFGSSGLVGSSIRAHLNLDFLHLFIYTRANDLLCIRNGLPHLVESNLSLSHSLRLAKPDIIINAAGFTHTSVAIRDALDIYKKPIIELHISNIYKREKFRQKSLISDIATGGIFGLGDNGYILAIIAMQNILKK